MRPPVIRINADKMFVSSRYGTSEIKPVRRRVIDFRKLFVDRIKGFQNLRERFLWHGFDDERGPSLRMMASRLATELARIRTAWLRPFLNSLRFLRGQFFTH